MNTIATFRSRFDPRYHDRTTFAHRNPSSLGDRTLPTAVVADGPIVAAHVNASRWIALCPLEEPHGGCEYVDPDDPVFFCCECRNADVGHAYLPVVFPKERAEIEAVLLGRPNPRNRRWEPPETVDDLLAENAALLGDE